jgi:hypothetical protein
MKTLSSFHLGTSIVAATVASIALAAAPAQAALLNLARGDTLKITGQATLSPDFFVQSDIIGFTSAQVASASTGGFKTNYFDGPATLTEISNIEITQVGGEFSFNYTGQAENPFLKFSDGVEFVVNNPFDFFRIGTGTQGVALTLDEFSGNFLNVDGAVVLAEGTFQATPSDTGVSYSMTLLVKDAQYEDVQNAPEPLTTLGTALAFGFGGLFHRQRSGKGKNQKQV